VLSRNALRIVNEGASATTPTTAPFTAQTAAAVHRAVVPHRHLEMIVRHPKANAWWRFR
jgi:hypothetical protein